MKSPRKRRTLATTRRRRHVCIPDSWAGDQALVVVAFLEEVIHAIWRAHGAKMAPILAAGLERPGELAPLPCATCLDDPQAEASAHMPF
jgi:hypothetical protein